MNLLYIQWAEYRDDEFYVKWTKTSNWYEVNEKLNKLKWEVNKLSDWISRTQYIREYNDIKKVCVLFWYTLPKDKEFIF